jgi:hypothetical protein
MCFIAVWFEYLDKHTHLNFQPLADEFEVLAKSSAKQRIFRD